jgi:hypothetical protein
MDKNGLTRGDAVCADGVRAVLDDLGVRSSHLLLSDILVMVEGINGVGVVEEWMSTWSPLQKLVRDSGVCITLHQFNPPDVRNPNFQMDRIKKLNPHVCFFVDRDEDPKSGAPNQAVVRLEELCRVHGLACIAIKDVRSLERLFTETAIREALPQEAKGWRYDGGTEISPVQSLESHLKQGWCSRSWNRRVAQKMTEEELRASGDIARLLNTVTQIAQQVVQSG